MISASKSTLSLKNVNILRPDVMKNLTNFQRSFVNPHPVHELSWLTYYPEEYVDVLLLFNVGAKKIAGSFIRMSNLYVKFFFLLSAKYYLLLFRHSLPVQLFKIKVVSTSVCACVWEAQLWGGWKYY